MDRANQAASMLREAKSKGLSSYDSRQLLLRTGFSNSEVDDAFDKLDSQPTPGQATQSSATSVPTEIVANQPGPLPTIPEIAPAPTNNFIASYVGAVVGAKVKGAILLASFAVVFAAGNFYSKHPSSTRLALYFAALGLSVVVAIYLDFILPLRIVSGGIQRLVVVVIGAFAFFICCFFLWFASMSVLH